MSDQKQSESKQQPPAAKANQAAAAAVVAEPLRTGDGQAVATDEVPKPFREPVPEKDEDVSATIRAYLKDKELSKVPAVACSQAIFPGQPMSARFERLFREVVSPKKPEPETK